MIVVTGGTGFVGRQLIHRLLSERRAVRALSRGQPPVGAPAGLEWAAGDLTRPSTLASAIEGAHTVIHLAAILADGRAPASQIQAVNVGGTRAIASAARAAGVRRFVHVSSAAVYGDGLHDAPHEEADPPHPVTPYDQSKLEAERVLVATLEGSSVDWVILRPPGLYGPDRPATAALFRDVAHRPLWLHGPAPVCLHPTHVLDLVGAIVHVLNRADIRAEVLNIGGSRPVEYRELIALIGARVGRHPLQVSAPSWSRHMAAGLARAWSLAGTPPGLLLRLSRRRVNRAVNIEKARRLLGFQPVGLEWGLDQTAVHLREAGLLA